MVSPVAAACGSVKTTWGTGMPAGTASGARPAACAAILSPTIRAWYLPIWVRAVCPLASPTA